MNRIHAYLFIFIFSLLLFFTSSVVDSQDGFQYLTVARNIYYHGTPTVPPPIDYNDYRVNIPLAAFQGKDGRYYGYTGIGFSMALLPAVFINDVVNKSLHIPEPIHFPLESDWLLLILANLTSVTLGALLGIVMYEYIRTMHVEKKHAIFFSIISIFSTNMFIYSRSIFPHIIFVLLMMFSFLFLKLFSVNQRGKYLIYSGLAFGFLTIVYNQTFFLIVPAYLLYYFLLTKPPFSKNIIHILLRDFIRFFIGVLPFLFIYFWYEHLRTRVGSDLTSASFYLGFLFDLIKNLHLGIFIESIWEQLFSFGRSPFLYTPLLLVIPIFWYKIKRPIKSEFIAYFVLCVTYIVFYAAQTSTGSDFVVSPLWHGESSWGPRYLTSLIPLGIVIVAYLWRKLSTFQRNFVFIPLAVLGFLINFLGVIIPNQVKFHNMQRNFYVNGHEFTYFYYINILPRFSPLITMPKSLIKIVSNIPKTFDHGYYNVRFFDGIDFPFDVGRERWRSIDGVGYISFDNKKEKPIQNITLDVINHPLDQNSSISAKMRIYLNTKEISERNTHIRITERKTITIEINKEFLEEKNNLLEIHVDYGNADIISKRRQLFALMAFAVNGERVNLESIDFPYVSSLNQKILPTQYRTYGKSDANPWTMWEIHTQMYERTLDFWWLRVMYYWDFPKTLFLFILGGNIFLIAFSLKKLNTIS